MAKKLYIITFLALLVQGSFGTLGACGRILEDLKKQCHYLDQKIVLARTCNDHEKAQQLLAEKNRLTFKIAISESINEEYDKLAAQQKTVDDQMSVLRSIENEQWSKCVKEAHEKNPTAVPLMVNANDVINAIQEKQKALNPDGRYGGQVCTQLVTAYANLAEFAYIHLNEYPKNQELLRKRLEIFACGICQKERWREEQCTVIVGEAHELLKEALGIENNAVSADKEVVESPEETYTSVRDLCDNSNYIGWGNKHYILTTLSDGLEAQCASRAQEDKDRASCAGMANRLHEKLFYNDSRKN